MVTLHFNKTYFKCDMKTILKHIINLFGYDLIRKEYLERYFNFHLLPFWEDQGLMKKIGLDNNPVIFDVGANVGALTLKFNSFTKNSCVYSFEPVKSTFEILKKNTINLNGVKIYNFAFGDKGETVEIPLQQFDYLNSIKGNLFDNRVNQEFEKIEVRTLDSFVKENNIKKINLLKSDTENYEIEVLTGAEMSLKNGIIDAIYVEVGFFNEDLHHTNFNKILEFLVNFNFVFIALYDPCYHGKYYYANALFIHKSCLYDVK